MKKFEATVAELSGRLGQEREVVYGLVRYLEKTGQAKIVRVQPPANGKGKGSNVYEFPAQVVIDMTPKRE